MPAQSCQQLRAQAVLANSPVGGSEDPTAEKEPYSGDLPSLRLRRYLARSRKPQRCDKKRKICKLKGSPGPDSCHKNCVDQKTDLLNCGKCGRSCKGRCVNLAFDRKNCGRCGNKCRKGSYCLYGMCGYA
ncbi:stigma-specific STIG1-like protein 1 [Nymphaea colorata]|uniref:stigma-specific STIG1-like protein 1 n=1 Tax=Nymphaea colorata TaxID=210225 RepID=UPI00129D6844|nr:stigma-specific STIG1-like protein 1 [Nymphaea colorata]